MPAAIVEGSGGSNNNTAYGDNSSSNNNNSYVPNNPEGLILDASLWKAIGDSNNNNNSDDGSNLTQLRPVEPIALPPFNQQQNQPTTTHIFNFDDVHADSEEELL